MRSNNNWRTILKRDAKTRVIGLNSATENEQQTIELLKQQRVVMMMVIDSGKRESTPSRDFCCCGCISLSLSLLSTPIPVFGTRI